MQKLVEEYTTHKQQSLMQMKKGLVSREAFLEEAAACIAEYYHRSGQEDAALLAEYYNQAGDALTDEKKLAVAEQYLGQDRKVLADFL